MQLQANGLSYAIYPNPNNGNFTIEMENGFNENSIFVLINSLGQTVYSRNIANGEKEFTVISKNMAKGMYLGKIITGSRQLTQKIIIE